MGNFANSAVELFTSQEFKAAASAFAGFVGRLIKLSGAVLVIGLTTTLNLLAEAMDNAKPLFEDIALVLEDVNTALDDIIDLITGQKAVEETVFANIADDLERLNPFAEIFTNTMKRLGEEVRKITERDDLDSIAIALGAIVAIFIGPTVATALAAFTLAWIGLQVAIEAIDPFLDTLAAVGDLINQ